MSLIPLFKWSGGKRKELPLIKSHLPSDYSTYVEPFVGAGALFFDIAHPHSVISDVHPEVFNFYNQIKEGNAVKIHELMSKHTNDEDTYYKIRALKPKNNIEAAFKFFYIRKTCYRGMLRYNKKGEFNIPFGRYKSYNFDILLNSNYHKLLSSTNIHNCDFADMFELYGNDPETFIFLDPPYDSVFTNYGYCTFDESDHRRLAKCFQKCRAKCLMIISRTPLIEELYKDYICAEYDKKYAFKIYDNRVNESAVHLVIKNYK